MKDEEEEEEEGTEGGGDTRHKPTKEQLKQAQRDRPPMHQAREVCTNPKNDHPCIKRGRCVLTLRTTTHASSEGGVYSYLPNPLPIHPHTHTLTRVTIRMSRPTMAVLSLRWVSEVVGADTSLRKSYMHPNYR